MDSIEPDKKTVKVGSRKSQLALVQTHSVVDMLSSLHPHINFEVVTMSTKGDQVLDQPLSKIGEKSLFTKELEIALEDLKVDMVVHSLKDLPSTLPPGMAIAAVIQRDSPYDTVVFSSSKHSDTMTLASLPEGAVIGTSSLRRVAQLKRAYPHLKFADVRGNLNTRLRKLDASDGIYDALVLAEAGLDRLGWHDRIHEVLKPDVCMYAISQGAMAVECRSFDLEVQALLAPLHDRSTLLRCLAERALLRTLEGGCSVPIATASEVTDGGNRLTLKAGVFSLDGSEAVIEEESVEFESPVNGNAQVNGTAAASSDEPAAKRQRRPSCPYSEAVQGHPVRPETVSTRYLSVKRKTCPYFSGIIARTYNHDLLEKAENVGIAVAKKLKAAGADEVLTKAKSENDKLKAIMDEERRLKLENEHRLQDIRNEVATAAASGSANAATVVQQMVEGRHQPNGTSDAITSDGVKAGSEVPAKCPVKH